VRGLFDKSYNGDLNLQLYMIGVVLINKFVNSVGKEDTSVVNNLKKSYLSAFAQVNANPQYMELLKIIVDDNSLSYSQFIDSDGDKQFEVRLRKTFLQYMLSLDPVRELRLRLHANGETGRPRS
jgi:hypothetical protein